LKIAVVGAGKIARTAHLPAYKSLPAVEVVAVVDKSRRKAKWTARKFGIQKFFGDCADLVRDESVSLIDLCTPPQVRLEVIKLAAEAGKHILVEKPLALSLGESLQIYRVVKENNVKLCLVKNYRYFPSALKVRDRIRSGYLGKIVSMHGTGFNTFPANQTRARWPYFSQGNLYDIAPHLIDMLLWLNPSSIRKIFALGGDFTSGTMGFINYAKILMEFEDGSLASADTSWLNNILGMKFTIDIYGTGGNILLDVRNDSFLEFHGMLTPLDELGSASRKALKIARGILTGNFFRGANAFYKRLISDFIDSIQNDETSPIPVEQGVVINAVLEGVEKSLLEGRPIFIEELFPSKRELVSILNVLYPT